MSGGRGRDPVLAQIHCAKRDLALDETSYRGVLFRVTGKDSAGAMTAAERRRALDEFRRLGWRPSATKWRTPEPRADQRFALVLWRLLAEAGVVRPGRAALNAFVASPNFAAKWGEAATDIRFLSAARTADVIEALKDMCHRHCVQIRWLDR